MDKMAKDGYDLAKHTPLLTKVAPCLNAVAPPPHVPAPGLPSVSQSRALFFNHWLARVIAAFS